MTKTNRQKHSTRTLKVVGHRGARALAPENTVASIYKALEHGVDEIEIDARITKDGAVVVHHDRDLQDHTTARYDIRKHTYAELVQLKPDLARLEEAIEAVNRKVPLQIEIKWGELTIPVVRVLDIYLSKGWHENDFLIGSKKQSTLMEIHRSLPSIPKVVIEPFSGVRAGIRARQLGTKRISMRWWWLWSFFISSVSRRGYQLYAYSLNDPKRARRWAAYGLAGVITDYPNRFQRATIKVRSSKNK